MPIERTLGILIDWEADKFLFKIDLQAIRTMRQLLHELASIHDPLGLIAPVVLPIRIMMQESWRLDQRWDDPLLEKIIDMWTRLKEEMLSIENLRIPRCVRQATSPSSMEINAFRDASEDGFGAGVYIRTTYQDQQVNVRLAIGKSRVAPLRQLSIPRLELQGAVMAV